MKAFRAHDLATALRSLQNQASLVFDGRGGIQYRLAAVDLFRGSLETIKGMCEEFELPMSSLHASQLLRTTASPGREQLDTNSAERIAAMLSITVENELSLRSFFLVSADRSKYYCETSQELLGEATTVASPSVSFDAVEAGRCFALGGFTGSVFHLMRVLETGLSVLAARFGIASNHTNWHNVIEGIEKAVRDMPNDPARSTDWKDQQEFFSQAASHFMVLKDAWRNYTAHARGKYTDPEAETIMINVRAFMQKLATRLQE